jgi:hypothetical protein
MMSFHFGHDIGVAVSSYQMVAQWIPGPHNALPFSSKPAAESDTRFYTMFLRRDCNGMFDSVRVAECSVF